jgi:hypothetical protein
MLGDIKLLKQAGWNRATAGLDTEASLKEQYAVSSAGEIVCRGGSRGAAPDDNGVVVSSL